MTAISPTRTKQIGLIVLQADETLERDMRVLLPASVEYLVTRIPSATTVTSATLQDMESSLAHAASLLPRGADLAAVAYGCTSGTAQIGAKTIAARVRDGVDTKAVTDPVTALVAACRALGVTRIGLISPYVSQVSEQLCAVLAEAGITVPRFFTFDEPLEENVVRIASDKIMAAGLEIGHDRTCEAVFLSCTNLRTLDVIAPLEAAIGKPVLSSNQVLAWHLCVLADVENAPVDAGTLFERT